MKRFVILLILVAILGARAPTPTYAQEPPTTCEKFWHSEFAPLLAGLLDVLNNEAITYTQQLGYGTWYINRMFALDAPDCFMSLHLEITRVALNYMLLDYMISYGLEYNGDNPDYWQPCNDVNKYQLATTIGAVCGVVSGACTEDSLILPDTFPLPAGYDNANPETQETT